MRLYYGITQEQKDYIQKRYDEGVGSLTIAKELGITVSRVSGYIKRHMSPRDHKHAHIKATCNDNYFDVIDSEDKAYWLGFIMADGYISCHKQASKKLGISLSTQDINHLEKFKSYINFSGNIKTYINTSGYKVGSQYSRLIVSSDHLCNALEKLGIVEHKTKIAQFPKQLQLPFCKFKKDFIRGYIDGDGSIAITTTSKTPAFKLGIVGTYDMLTNIRAFFVHNGLHVPKNYYKRRPEHVVFQYDFGGNRQVYNALKLLYEDATVYLDRKYQRYQLLCKMYNSRT